MRGQGVRRAGREPSGARSRTQPRTPFSPPRRSHRLLLPPPGLVRGMWVGLSPPRRLKTPLGLTRPQPPVPSERPRRIRGTQSR